jgi:hypothetical protein
VSESTFCELLRSVDVIVTLALGTMAPDSSVISPLMLAF